VRPPSISGGVRVEKKKKSSLRKPGKENGYVFSVPAFLHSRVIPLLSSCRPRDLRRLPAREKKKKEKKIHPLGQESGKDTHPIPFLVSWLPKR
jgi:hypothetical protein